MKNKESRFEYEIEYMKTLKEYYVFYDIYDEKGKLICYKYNEKPHKTKVSAGLYAESLKKRLLGMTKISPVLVTNKGECE
jgi:hypothetical protein